jgi:hypothetical protein
MVTLDRIRLTGLLPKSPAPAGLFHSCRGFVHHRCITNRGLGGGFGFLDEGSERLGVDLLDRDYMLNVTLSLPSASSASLHAGSLRLPH